MQKLEKRIAVLESEPVVNFPNEESLSEEPKEGEWVMGKDEGKYMAILLDKLEQRIDELEKGKAGHGRVSSIDRQVDDYEYRLRELSGRDLAG
jgi:hypothetical protein